MWMGSTFGLFNRKCVTEVVQLLDCCVGVQTTTHSQFKLGVKKVWGWLGGTGKKQGGRQGLMMWRWGGEGGTLLG